MKTGFFIGLILCLILLWGPGLVKATPYQLIEMESAILIEEGAGEFKIDYSKEREPFETEVWKGQYRLGIFSWMEVALSATQAKFIEQNESRLAEGDLRLKFHLFAMAEHEFFSYLKYREAQGEPIMKWDFEVDGVFKVVSPYADQGKDSSLGFLVRSPLEKWGFVYHLGVEYTKATNRDYEDFRSDQDILSGLFALQMHFFNKTLMLALENRYVYWLGRGDYYKILPQVRWEFMNDWIIEAGVSKHLVGGGETRGIVGVTFEYD